MFSIFGPLGLLKLQQPRNYDFGMFHFNLLGSQGGNSREMTTSPPGHRWEATVLHSQQPPNYKKSEPTAVKWRVRNSTRSLRFCVVSWLLSFQVPFGILRKAVLVAKDYFVWVTPAIFVILSISGLEVQNPLFLCVEWMQGQNFRRFSSKLPVFGRGTKTTFSKKTVSTTPKKNSSKQGIWSSLIWEIFPKLCWLHSASRGPNGLLALAHQNRAVKESLGKSEIPGPNYFCALSQKLLRHGNSDHLMSFKERVFHASHFCDLYRSCAGTDIISEAPFLDFWFSDFFISEAGAKKKPARSGPGPLKPFYTALPRGQN